MFIKCDEFALSIASKSGTTVSTISFPDDSVLKFPPHPKFLFKHDLDGRNEAAVLSESCFGWMQQAI